MIWRSGDTLLISQDMLQRKYQINKGFGKDTKELAIRCVKPYEGSKIVKKINEFIDEKLVGLRVRENLNELEVSNEYSTGIYGPEIVKSLSDVKLAKLSYTKNAENGSKNVTAEDVLGYRFKKITPFLAYEFQEVREVGEDDVDVEVISPGIQLSKIFSFEGPLGKSGSVSEK